jgi:4-hydroxybenzoate polyprenyltransferase
MNIKRIIKSVWDEFIYGSHFIALAGASISIIGADLLSIKLTWQIPIMFYLLLQFGFFYNRYRDFRKDFLTNPERTKHIEKYIKYLPFIILFFGIFFSSILIYFGNKQSVLLGLIMLFLAFLYSEIAKGLTKKIFMFKDFYFASCWALLVILLTLFYYHQISLGVILLSLFIFLRILLSTTLFDIKDTISDKEEKLKTLSVIIGEKKAYKFLILLCVLAFTPILIGIYLAVFPFYAISLTLTIPYTYFYLYQMKKKKLNPILLHYLIIGSEFNFYLVFLFIGKVIFI